MEGNRDFSDSVDKCFIMYDPLLKIEKLLFLLDNGVKRTGILNEACRLIKLGDNATLLRMVRTNYQLDDDDDDDMWLRRANARFSRRKINLESGLDATSWGKPIRREERRKLFSMLGELHYDYGDLNEAFRIFHEELESCTMETQVIESHLKLILVSLKRGKLEDVLQWVDKVRERGGGSMESIVAAKVTCACALGNMGLQRYKTAAREFLDVSCGLGDTFNEVILPRDVAIYGGLCALATYDRSEIKQGVLANNHAWRVLGFAPEIRKIITEFHKGHYTYCLNYLQSIKPNLLLDIYAFKHVERLFDQIREKALLEYAQPFESLNLDTMAREFNSSVSGLEKELVVLITDNKLQALVDSDKKVLYRGSFQ
ncbi:unnamed protein product [Arabidopsis halleri]